MSEHYDDIEARLRASLADQARRAPDGGPLSEQILASVANAPRQGQPPAERSRWRTWGLPLVAAAAVAAAIGGGFGISHLGRDADHAPPAHQTSSPPATAPSPPPSTASVVTGTPSARPPTSQAHDFALTHLRVRDLTFVGPNQGWALGIADCLSGSGTCTALAYTADGLTWAGRGTTPFNVPGVGDCAAPCVTNIRFATENIGYAFGPDALFMTTDAAATWQRFAGGAAALETLNGNVLRVVAQPSGCTPPGCSYAVQTAPIGGSAWQPTDLTNVQPPGMSTGVQLSRAPNVVVLAVFGHPTGGASEAHSAVYFSLDDGVTWTALADPCGSFSSTEVDTTSVTSATDGSMAFLCTPRAGGGSGQFVLILSSPTPSGELSFGRGSGAVPQYASNIAAASSTVVMAESSALYRTSDGGDMWSPVAAGGGLASVSWLGFQNASTGRAVQTPSAGPTTIWTTHDGGASWTPTRLP